MGELESTVLCQRERGREREREREKRRREREKERKERTRENQGNHNRQKVMGRSSETVRPPTPGVVLTCLKLDHEICLVNNLFSFLCQMAICFRMRRDIDCYNQ